MGEKIDLKELIRHKLDEIRYYSVSSSNRERLLHHIMETGINKEEESLEMVDILVSLFSDVYERYSDCEGCCDDMIDYSTFSYDRDSAYEDARETAYSQALDDFEDRRDEINSELESLEAEYEELLSEKENDENQYDETEE